VFAHKKSDAAFAFLSRGGLGCSFLDDYNGNSHADLSWWLGAKENGSVWFSDGGCLGVFAQRWGKFFGRDDFLRSQIAMSNIAYFF
jgi:hypothetical protein